MWIQLDCPNGHPVKVDAKFAGRMGRCPACGSRIRIPEAATHDATEDAILDLLGTSATATLPVHQEARRADSGASGTSSSLLNGSTLLHQAMKICAACKRKVSTRYQICPHCRTYMPITDLNEVNVRASLNCQMCGAPSFPGASVCGNCGESIR